tara:strand:- start:339 stop:554 length:216 start_codon:yes stop_codon:yes gene_type:complete
VQAGDLVKRKPAWGEWVKRNPWMITEKDLEVGIILEVFDDVEVPPAVKIMWSCGLIDKDRTDELELINENH